MKKILGIVVLGLLWCNISVAGDYDSTLKKLKKANDKEIVEVLNEIIIGLTHEKNLVDECFEDLKNNKSDEAPNTCHKVFERYHNYITLEKIYLHPSFKNKLLKLEKKINKGSIEFININDLATKWSKLSDLTINIDTSYNNVRLKLKKDGFILEKK